MENYLQHAEHYYRMLNANGVPIAASRAPADGNGSNGAGNGIDGRGQRPEDGQGEGEDEGGTETWPPMAPMFPAWASLRGFEA
jgi:hypothetical protein